MRTTDEYVTGIRNVTKTAVHLHHDGTAIVKKALYFLFDSTGLL